MTSRLNWGCGESPAAAGWTNSDRIDGPEIDACCDIRDGLPYPDESFDYAVAIHALQDLGWADIPHALDELRRVLRRGDGVLRIAVPDLDRAIDAYRDGRPDYFYIPDNDMASIGGKLVTQIIWYGAVRTPFTYDFLAERLHDAGFVDIVCCAFGQTTSRHPEIASLDNRPRDTVRRSDPAVTCRQNSRR